MSLARYGHWGLRGLWWLGALTGFYFLIVFELGWLAANRSYEPAESGIPIYVWSNGIHVDLVLPRKTDVIDWGEFAPLERGTPSTYFESVFVGWGDHDFYTEIRTQADFSYAITLKAIFLPTRSVMHMSYWTGTPKLKEKCVRLWLRKEEYRRLVEFVKTGFAYGSDERPQLIEGLQHGANDVFFHGAGRYHLFQTCNNWANQALRHAGVKTAIWAPLDFAIFNHVKNE